MTSTTSMDSTAPTTAFEVYVSKDTFKFNAAHFVAYKGFRERLHGHNYKVAVRLLGSRKIGPDGYVLDFGCVKAVTKKICKGLNEHFLCPMRSDVMGIAVKDDESCRNGGTISLTCEDGSVFVFPKKDCALLPIVHATTEELAIYLWGEILGALNSDYLLKRGMHTMEVTVAEAVGQEALFRHAIPDSAVSKEDVKALSDVGSYIQNGDIVPMPCPTSTEAAHGSAASASAAAAGPPPEKKQKRTDGCDDGCKDCQAKLSAKLQQLAKAINAGTLGGSGSKVEAKDLEDLLSKSETA
jgi:6-pyruvoyl-tetrahydropterin synthase